MMINCHREIKSNETPFIPEALSLSLRVTETQSGAYRGVNFTNSQDNISPHIHQTHCESSLHVFCKDVESSLSDILNGKPELRNELDCLHIKVRATTLCDHVLHVECQDDVYKVNFNLDSYSVYSETPVSAESFAAERVIFREEVEAAVARCGVKRPFKVLLIDVVGEENCMKDWAFLSNEATNYIVHELGAEVVVLNTPSIDRESDGGFVPNHKIVFENRNNLVVELASLSHLQEQYGRVLLNVTPHDTYADCGACSLQFIAH